MQAELFWWKSSLLMALTSCSYKGILDFRGPDYLSYLVKREKKIGMQKKRTESSLLALQIEIKKNACLFVFVLWKGGCI